jgi:hypothetical protein
MILANKITIHVQSISTEDYELTAKRMLDASIRITSVHILELLYDSINENSLKMPKHSKLTPI